mgnify:CR=1 FL=1
MHNLSLLLFIALFFISCKEPQEVVVVEEEPPLTFENCSQLIDANPCNFTLKNQHDKEIELYDFYGKVIIVDFSAMWCGPCVSMGMASEEIVTSYGAENVEWLTLIIEDEQGDPPDQDDLIRWAQTTGITGHVLASDRSIIDATATTGYPISGWPTYVVIDREMVIKHGSVGWSESMLRSILDLVVGEVEDG